ncbi:hypothetical protein TanjilG_14531 [Lupinus angustifolius]|uniref:Uncharacterized protein n=1 Tax=Lupinus angustifolius TaxID=3871 RepID=A0A1J7GM46_LUPAN|nr:hypothetical protein TanjilG_14531 [Lupinus angustifolius]
MAQTKKPKSRDVASHGREKTKPNFDSKNLKSFKSKTHRKKSGPHLPSSLKKEVERLNPNTNSFGSDESDYEDGEREILVKDLYEYEEEQAEEESKKNKRYDAGSVDKLEYELPDDLSDDFKDEDVESEDDDDDDDMSKNRTAASNESEEEDEERHARMLQGVTGMPTEAFEGKRKNKKMKDTVLPELYQESEYNSSRDVVNGDGLITIEDLLNPLHEKPGFGELRKRMNEIEKKARTIHAPLPKADQAKIERRAAYERSKKDVTKWQPIIQKNREAPTVFFDENVDLGFSTVGAIASEFEPRTEFEMKMAALVRDDKVMEAHKRDGSRLLEMNMVSVEDEKDRQNRIAKMHSLLFRHERKAKHMKKIKSKTYHRLLKKDRLKEESSRIEMDPEAAKEYAMKQERQRAEERMTLRHKNQNRWAKRILQRGLSSQDEGTRAAIAEQLQRHAALSRKMHSMKDSSSSSDDTSDEDENSDGSDQDRVSKLLGKAKEKTMRVLEEEDEVPKSGLLSLPFMRRGLEKRKEAAVEEANILIQEYEDSLMKLGSSGGSEDPKAASVSGRRVFGTAKPQISDAGNKTFAGDDVEDDFEKDKQEILNRENPEPEKPVSLPGWGQWTHIQQKKGEPSWMLKEHENAQRKRAEALKRRKDAQLKNVIISEKLDKKAEKLHTKALPFPFTSKEMFEQSMRVPIGPEFNPATAIGPLNRPEFYKHLQFGRIEGIDCTMLEVKTNHCLQFDRIANISRTGT